MTSSNQQPEAFSPSAAYLSDQSAVPCNIYDHPCPKQLAFENGVWKLAEKTREAVGFSLAPLRDVAYTRIDGAVRHNRPEMLGLEKAAGKVEDCASCINYITTGLNEYQPNNRLTKAAATPQEVSGQIQKKSKTEKDKLRLKIDCAEIIFTAVENTKDMVNELKDGEKLSGKVVTTYQEGMTLEKGKLHIFAQTFPHGNPRKIEHQDLLKGTIFENLKAWNPENMGGCLFTVTREKNLLIVELFSRSGKFGPIKFSNIANEIARKLKQEFEGQNVQICTASLDRPKDIREEMNKLFVRKAELPFPTQSPPPPPTS